HASMSAFPRTAHHSCRCHPPLSSHASPHLRDPPSFPTRRSSDLQRVSQFALALVLLLSGLLQAQTTISSGSIQGTVTDQSGAVVDRKSTRLNSSHVAISYAVFCLKKKTTKPTITTFPKLTITPRI